MLTWVIFFISFCLFCGLIFSGIKEYEFEGNTLYIILKILVAVGLTAIFSWFLMMISLIFFRKHMSMLPYILFPLAILTGFVGFGDCNFGWDITISELNIKEISKQFFAKSIAQILISIVVTLIFIEITPYQILKGFIVMSAIAFWLSNIELFQKGGGWIALGVLMLLFLTLPVTFFALFILISIFYRG